MLQKAVFFGLFILFVGTVGLMFFLVLFGILDEGNPNVTVNRGAILPGVLISTFLILGAITINIAMPDLHVSDDGFRLVTVFSQSQIVQWEDILFVERTPFPKWYFEAYGVGLHVLHPIYNVIGFAYLLSGKAFLLAEKIDNFELLMQLIEERRPDLFSSNSE
jgi:hypothetical protein